jgi:hypothetical protein
MSVKFSAAAIAVVLFISSCSERKSRDRFEEVCGIALPEDVEVLKDEFIDAGKDYGIQFNVQMGPEDRRKCAASIRSSKLFTNDTTEKSNAWQPTQRGFRFFRAKDGIFYNIEVDTVSGVVTYNELG